MATHRAHPFRARLLLPALAALLFVPAGLLAAPAGRSPSSDVPPLPAVFQKAAPEDVKDLRAIQKQVKAVLKKVRPCVVGVRVGPAQGSGVIVSEDGYVLTAGHVSGTPGRDVVLLLPDGKQLKGKTLGHNKDIDSGLIKITTEGKYPFVPMGKSANLKKGQWVLTVGHPGGYQKGRKPVVRLGRIQRTSSDVIQTDCTLVGGDSGGPLFDMQGKVIGIHSRIGRSLAQNMHVPVDTYQETWDRLVSADSWGGKFGSQAYIGVISDKDAKECRISEVVKNSPAARAGLKVNDVVLRLNEAKIETFADLKNLISKKKPGEKIKLEVKRGERTVTLNVTLGTREDD